MSLAALQGVKGNVGVDLSSMALEGKKISMQKVMKTVDDMENLLGEEQNADEAKKEQCEKGIDEKLDKQVAEATETRKEEIEDHVVNLAANSSAVEISGCAKNRLSSSTTPLSTLRKCDELMPEWSNCVMGVVEGPNFVMGVADSEGLRGAHSRVVEVRHGRCRL